jgi:hypothetical protein
MTEKIDRGLIDIKRQVRKFRIDETRQRLEKLDELIASKNYPKISAAEARLWLLESAENFRIMYDAKIKSPLREEKSSMTLSIEFTYVPESSEDFLQLLNFLNESISPVYFIEQMRVNSKFEMRTVSFEVKLIQPYFGGNYVF